MGYLRFGWMLVVLSFALPARAQQAAWEKQWDDLTAAARKEGKIVVMGSADPVVRKELPAVFKTRFGIALEYIGGRGSDNLARLRTERAAGIHTVDAVMVGLTNMVDYYREKMLAPLRPALVLPEVNDPYKWKKGKLWFVDPEESYALRLYNYVSTGLLYINTKHATHQEFKSIKGLLDPKWSGKISSLDPTVSGPGQAEAARFLLQFGEEFVKRLYLGQKPAFSRDKRQIVDWLAHGSYPVSISAETEFVVEMKNQGLPVDMVAPADAPGSLTGGNGLLALLDKAPHPNAARLFVNWVASREGMVLLGRARRKPTTRNDINESYAQPWEVPQPGLNYFDLHDWEFTTKTRDVVNQRIRELLASR